MAERRIVREEFRSFSMLIDTLNSRPNNSIMSSKNESETNSLSFSGTYNMKEAVKMLSTGYLAVLNKLERGVRQQQKINAKYISSIEHPIPHNAIVGFVPNVPNAIRNIPQSMVSIDRKPMKKKTLHILYSNNGNCNQTTDWFINAGTALLSAIDIIERSGIQTKIDLAFFTSEAGNEMTFPTICIKNYGERFSLQKISFPLVHPSMFRRIGFKWLETTPDIKSDDFAYGYGHAPDQRRIEECLKGSLTPDTYLISTGTINEMNCSVPEILKKFEVI